MKSKMFDDLNCFLYIISVHNVTNIFLNLKFIFSFRQTNFSFIGEKVKKK